MPFSNGIFVLHPMRHICSNFLLFLVIGFNTAFAQNTITPKAGLSANLQQYLLNPNAHPNTLVTADIAGKTYLSALVKVGKGLNTNDFDALNVKIGTKAGNIWTVLIPELNIEAFTMVKGIEYIQLDEPVFANLDASRKAIRVDSVHSGIALPMGYSGKNVVVGIIDAGFDYSHPTFYDTTGTKLRIKRVWEQRNAGTPPSGFAYGNEITDTSAMLQKGNEIATFSHGTHVAGIAAGSGYGGAVSRKYRGMAYEADLVFVGIRPEKEEWKTSGMASIIDGMKYIYDYAASVGKPAVVNLSWGCSIGPNDGTSLFSQACNNLTGAGRLFVLAAGNNGEEKIHIKKGFSPADTLLNTFITFDASLGSNRTWVDIWGEKSQTFCIKLALYNGTILGNSSQVICLDGSTRNLFLVGKKNDTCFITVSAIASDFNQKPHVLLDIYSKSGDVLNLSVIGHSGNVHLWEGYVESYIGYYGTFTSNGQAFATDGDANFTLGEMASTASALTVAAYASKVSFKNLSGGSPSYSSYTSVGSVVPFSSHGPTADLRRKPDIAAPGLTIASAVNSYDVTNAFGGPNYSRSVSKFVQPRNGRTYYYAESSGTSMASPAASGVLALMLQAHPYLGPNDVKNILNATAIKDANTTAKPDSTRWGAGKINAYGAVKGALVKLEVVAPASQLSKIQVYPNPNGGEFEISFPGILFTPVEIVITNTEGKTVFKSYLPNLNGQHSEQIKTGLSAGLYFLHLRNNATYSTFKLMIR